MNGDNYISPLEFYLNNGFEILEKERLESSKITAIKIEWKR